MIRPIVRDVLFLGRKSEPATRMDGAVGRDLRDTLRANRDRCVGMAANMIGVGKRVIIVNVAFADVVMYNPVLLSKDTPYEAEEGCLSLTGTRTARRFRSITVRYQNERFETRLKTYTGFPAQIIQHEIDHCNGVLI